MRDFYFFPYLILLVFAISATTTHANGICSRYCKEHSSHKYQTGNVYTYKYEGTLKTLLNTTTSTDNNSASFSFNCVFNIAVLSPCDLVLKVESVNLIQNSNAQQFERDLKKNPLYFSFQSGRVNTICPTNEEPTDILNMKRAILSVFQSGVSSTKEDSLIYETDISGNCETHYRVLGRLPLTIEKEKNLEACSHRFNQYLSWNSVPYNRKSKKRSPPLLRSTQFCTQIYTNDGILFSSECRERHGLQPLSNGYSGAVTYVTQSLQMVSTTQSETVENLILPINRRTSLLFENKPEIVEKQIQIDSIVELLDDLKQKTTNGTEDDTPRLFSQLVYYVRNVHYEKLSEICDMIKESPTKQKILLDAISLVSTPDGIKIMRKLYEEGEISEYQINSWITSLAFTKNPSVEVLNEMKPLMTMSSSINQKAILSLSSLVHRFCQVNPDCVKIPEIKEIMTLLEAQISPNCAAPDFKSRSETLLALKGIGNSGVTTSYSLLQRCYSNEDLPVEIRLAALAAHRRFSCSENKNLDDFLSYFANPNENTEIRIAAYLASMECASLSTYTLVKDVLYKEETNQVGSFVWTHLTNLQETSSRWKQSLRLLTENYFLRNKFSTDIRKYSRNYEISSFFDSINVGGSVESNVIFTEDSYLPKSAMLNLTLDLFGQTVNVFEMDTRVEGLEDVVEKFFAPDGYFPEETINSALKRARGEQEKINDNIQRIGETFKKEKRLSGEPNLLMSFKAFGNEFAYLGLNDLMGLFGEPVTKKNLMDTLTKQFSRRKIDTTKSFVFLDSLIKVPTMLGLPLELALNGTATLGLTAHANVDLKDFRSMKLAVEGKIYPSAVVEVIGAMSVTSVYSKTGLTLIGRMSSNSYIDGHAFIDGGKLVDVKFNVPKNQFNVFNVQSHIFTVRDNEMSEIKNTTDNVNTLNLCSPKAVNSVTGFEVCSKLTYTNASTEEYSPYFPLTGAFEYSLGLKKIDHFENYVFNMKSDNRNGRSISLFFDTPGSKIKRTILAKYQLDWDNLLIDAQLSCPFAKIELSSNLSNKTNRNVYIQAHFNNKELLLFQSSLASKPYGNSWKYEPLAKLRYKSSPVAAMSGTVNFIRGSEYTIDLKLDGFAEDTVLIKGALNHSTKRYEASASVRSPSVSGDFTGSFMNDVQTFLLKFNSSYSVRKAKKESLGLILESKSGLKYRKFFASFQSTQKPLYDSLMSLDYKWDDMYFEGNGRVDLFKTSWELQQLFKFKQSGWYYVDFAALCSLSCTEKNINYTIHFAHTLLENRFGVHALLQLNRRQRLETLVEANGLFLQEKRFLVLVYYPEYTWTLEGNVKEKSSGVYSAFFTGNYEVETEKVTFVSVTGRYINSSLEAMQNHTISAVIEFPSSVNSPWFLNTVIQFSSDVLLCTSQLSVDSNMYLSHMVLMQSSISLIIQRNQKRLFFISGGKNRNEYSGTIALNIYQHFELNTRLLMPFQSFLFEFYWNKDRSADEKVSLALDKDNLGRYMMDLQYPNQKIVATLILLPSQVTLNITWGTHLSHRIYLEAGNTVYDVGGIWFAKLETPFEYLEEQEFALHYYVLSYMAKLKMEIKWRSQSVSVKMSGSKSETLVSGAIEMETTLPEIKQAFAIVNHLNNNKEIKNDAKFAFNNHEVTLASSWKAHGLNIISNFEMVSPTKSLLPIYGVLVMDNNVTTKFLNCSIDWQGKLMSLDYRFEKPHSHIKIVTPFEGIEETQFDYTLVAEVERLVLELKANLLRQENWALLSWDTEKNAVGVKLQVLSPITGNFRAAFKHSTMLGHLAEYLIVTQGKDNDILALKLYGDLFPIQNLDVTGEAVLLGYIASVSIENLQYPTTTTIKAKLNNDFIICKSVVLYENDTLSSVKWDVTSNILEKAIEFRYKRDGANYISLLSLPNGYKFENNLMIEGLAFIENNFVAATPQGSGLFNYSHKLTDLDFTHVILLRYDEKECNYSFYYNLNEYLNLLVDKVELKISTPWYHDILLDFSIAPESIPLNIWRPTLRFIYDDQNQISLTSSVKYEAFNSYLALKVQISERSVLELEISYDFTERLNKLRFKLQRPNSTHSLICDFKLEENDGLVLIKASNTTASILNGVFEYKLGNSAIKEALLSWELLYENFEMKLDAQVALSDMLKAEFEMNGDLSHFYFGSLLGLSTLPHQGYVKFGRNKKFVVVEYDLEEFNREVFILTARLTSHFGIYKNGSVVFRGENIADQSRLVITGNYGKENGAAEIVYGLSSSVLKTIYTSRFVGSFNLNCSSGIHLVSKIDCNVRSDTNGSKIDATFRSNVPHLKSLDLIIINKNLKNYYELDSKLIHESYTYTILHSTRYEDKNYVLTTLLTTPFFGNVTANLNYRANKGKMKASYAKGSDIYVAVAQGEFGAFKGNSVFTVQTPKNTYTGSLDLDITGKNRYVYLTVIFPNKITNVLEIRVGENLWPHLIMRLRVNLPSFKLPVYTLDLNYSYITQTGSLLLEYVKKEQKYKMEMRKSGTEFLLAVDVPKKPNYIHLNGSHNYNQSKFCTVDYTVCIGDSKLAVVIEIEAQEQLKAQTKIMLESSPFGNVTSQLMLDGVLNASLIFDITRRYDFILDKNAFLTGRNLLALTTNKEPLLTIWSGSEFSYLFLKYKTDDYNISLAHDISNRAGFDFTKNGNKQIAILGTWNMNGKNCEANTIVILSHTSLVELNITAGFRKNSEKYALDMNVSNGLRYIIKMASYFETQNTIYNAYVKLNTASEFLQSLEYFTYADTSTTTFETKILIAHHYVTNEYYALIKPDTQNLLLDLKYPCQSLENCKFYLNYKPCYFEARLEGPGREMKNFSVLAALTSNDGDKSVELKLINEWKYFLLHANLNVGDAHIALTSEIANNVLPVLRKTKFNSLYEFYKKLAILLDYEEVATKLILEMEKNVLNATFSAFGALIDINGNAVLILKDTYKVFEVNSLKNRFLLEMQLEQNLKNVSVIFHAPILHLNFDTHAVVTSTNKNILVRNDGGILFNMETVTSRAGKQEECMYVNVDFNKNTCKFNVTYNHETRMFNVTNLKLTNRDNFEVNAHGVFSAKYGDLKANVSGNRNFSLLWLLSDGSQKSIYKVAFLNDKKMFALFVEMIRPQLFSLKISAGNSNSTLNLVYLPVENGMTFTGFLEIFLGPRLYYLKNQLGYNFKNRVISGQVHNLQTGLSNARNVVYNHGTFNFLLESNFILRPLSMNFDYDVNALDFNNLQAMAVKTTCLNCEPTQISATLTSPFAGYKFLRLNTKLNYDLKLANITFEKDGVITDAQLVLNTNENAYTLHLKTKNDNKTLGNALIFIQNAQRKVKGTANINFSNIPFTTSLNFEPNKFKLMLNSPLQKLRNFKLSSSYSSRDFQTEGLWNDAKINIYAILKMQQKNELFLTSQIEIGQIVKGVLNAKKRKTEFEMFGYFPDKSSSVFVSVNTSNCNIAVKTPLEKVKEVNFDSKYNDSSVEMQLSGNALREDFILTGNVFTKAYHNFIANANCRIIKRHINWTLSGIFDVYKHSELKLNNLTAAYTFNKLRSGVAFDSYVSTENENNTLGFVWSTDPHYEFYLNDNKISEKVTIHNGVIETVIFSKIPFFNITEAGFLIARDVFTGATRNKLFYNKCYVDFEHRGTLDMKLKYFLPIVRVRKFLHIETRYQDETLFLKYCNLNSTCMELQGKYANNATDFNLDVLQNQTAIFVMNFAKTFNNFHLDAFSTLLLHLEYSNKYTSKLQISFGHEKADKHDLLVEFKSGEVFLEISSPALQPRPLSVTFNVKKVGVLDVFIRFDVKSVHSEIVNFVFTFETLPHAYSIDVGVNANNKSVYWSNIKIVQTAMTEIFATAHIFDKKNKLYLVLNKNNPYVFGITINTPFLPNDGFTFEALISKINKIFIFIGSGFSDLLQNGLINPDSHRNHITFYGFYQNQTLNAKIDTRGFNYLKEVDVGVRFLKNREATIYNTTVTIISNVFGNSSATFTYLSNATNINAYGHLHGSRFNNFDLNLALPLAINADFHPKFALNAFNKTYILQAAYKNIEKHKIHLSLGYEFLSLKFDGILEVAMLPKVTLIFHAISKTSNIQAAFNKNENSERAISYLILNEKRYEFVHAILFQANRKLVDISFTMPHANFSNYALLFEMRNTNEKLLKFYLNYPSFGDKKIGFEFGISPISLNNFSLISKISLPAIIENFTDGVLFVKHNFEHQRNFRTYKLDCEMKTNKHRFVMSVNAADVINLRKFSTSVFVDRNEFEVQLESSGSNIEELQAKLAVSTTLTVLKQLRLHLNNTKTFGAKYSCGFDYNFKEIFKGVYEAKNYTHYLEVVTPWKSLGGEYRYLNEESELHVKGLAYWDKNSQIGGHVYLGDYFSVGVVLPTRVCGIESSYINNQTDEIIAGRVYWNVNNSASLRIAFKNNTKQDFADLQYYTQLDTPFTYLEYIHKIQIHLFKGAAVKSLIFFKWNENPSSNLIVNTSLSNGSVQTKLSSPLLSHDITLNVLISALSDSLSKLRMELEYSDLLDKRLVFETCYQKTYTNVFATQRKILIQHPASKINYLLDFGTLRTEEFTNGTFKIRYMDYFTMNEEEINAFINIAHKKLAVWGRIKTNKNELSLKMKSNTGADFNSFSVLLQMNDKDPLVLTVQYKFRQNSPALTTIISYGNSRSYKMFLGLPTRKEIIASLTHETYNEQLADSLFTAKLNNSQLLWIKLQWKRDVLNRFYKILLHEYSDLKFVIEAIGRELIEVIDDDFGNQLVCDVSYMRTSFASYAKREAKEFRERYNKFLSDIREGVRRNAFYSKNIVEFSKVIGANFEFLSNIAYPIIDTIKFAYDTAIYIVNDAFVCVQYVGTVVHQHVENIIKDIRDVRKLKENAKNLLKMGIEDTQKSLREMQRLALEKLSMLEFYVAEIKEKVEEFFEPCLNVLDDFIVYVEQRLAVMQLILLDILDTIQSYIANLQEMQDIMKAYSIYFSWFEELHLMDLLEPVGNAIECVLEEIMDDIKRVYEDYKPYIEALYDALFGRYEQLIQLPPISEIRRFCNKIYQKTVWFWKYHNLSETIKNYIRDLITNIDDFLTILLELENLSGEDFETILQNADYVYRPDQGYIECSLPLVVEWQTFDTLPKFEQHSLYQKIQKKLNQLQQIQGYFAELASSLRSLGGFTFRTDLSPSVNNFALIIGGTHFITFDGYYYNFTGDCSYLLAGDFKSNTFSVMINYEKGAMKSLSVNTYNETIELTRDFDVFWNGNSVDLPIFMNTTTVTRNYKTISLKNSRGLTLICDYHYDICTIELSRWLFGKTGGLLGTLDNEKVTDLTYPNGTKTDSVENFASSWSVSSNTCQIANKKFEVITDLSPLEEELTDALCNALFVYRNSPLADCYHRVSPKPFLNICLTDVRSASNPTVCSAVVAYSRMCNNFGIPLKIPEMCVNCAVENFEIGPKEEIFDGHNPKSVDVVIIFNDACTNTSMNTLSLDLEKTLIQQGFYSKRYAYVGYGAAVPYIATFQKAIWSDASESIRFQKRFGSSGASAIDAIKFALQLDFRPRVTKIFVLLQCQACPHIDNIPSVYNLLGEKDVTLHVITLQPEFTSEYTAIDANGNVMYENKNSVETKNITNTQNNLIIDEISDSCSLLALGTNGTVANLGDYSKSFDFREKWAQFGLKTVKTSPCQKCKCVPDQYGISKVECVRCMAPAVKYLLNEYESNMVKYGA